MKKQLAVSFLNTLLCNCFLLFPLLSCRFVAEFKLLKYIGFSCSGLPDWLSLTLKQAAFLLPLHLCGIIINYILPLMSLINEIGNRMEEESTDFVWTNITSVIQITLQPFLFLMYAKTKIALGLSIFKRSKLLMVLLYPRYPVAKTRSLSKIIYLGDTVVGTARAMWLWRGIPGQLYPYNLSFPPLMGNWSNYNIIVWGVDLHWFPLLSLLGLFLLLSLRLQLLLMGVVAFLDSLSFRINWLWGLLLLR